MSKAIIEQEEKISGKVAIPEVINGAGIKSIEQTSTSSEDGGVNTITVTLTDGGTSTFEVRNGSKGSQGNPGEKGEKGESAAQPDWDQNDFTALDYIKNKPFYKVEDYTLLKEEDIVLTNGVGRTWNINWQVGQINIYYDGSNYELKREPNVIDAYYYWGYEKFNSGEFPFYVKAGVLGDSEAEIHTSFFDSPITVNCSYYTLETVYKPIDSVYLPSDRILPVVHKFDEGKFLRVSSDGKWVQEEVAMPDAVTDDHINSLIDAKAVTDDHINSLIDSKLGVIENGTY